MAGILRKPSYKYMHVILNQCVRGRMPQAMFAVFLHSLMRAVICLTGVSLALSFFPSGKASSPFAVLFAALVLITGFLLVEILTYGLYGIIAPLVRNKAASIKDIFCGFTDQSRRVVKAALAFTMINVAAMLLLGFLAALPGSPAAGLPGRLGENALVLVAALAYIVLAALLTLPFSFSYLILMTKAGTGVWQSFVLSWKMLVRQIPHFVGFIIYAGGRDIFMVVVIQFLLFVLPKGEGAASMQLLATLASFIGGLAEYRALTRGYMAVCIYFYGEAGILRPHGGQESVPGGTAGNLGGTDTPGDNAP
ncbi:MAG: hypothetical protein IJR93_01540 [Treponema sp.]|nr:hypothetical protein [Treponema sp.]